MSMSMDGMIWSEKVNAQYSGWGAQARASGWLGPETGGDHPHC